mmetsp:Transcript_11952/g.26470  ORF Transcript_11952/g.26470 Transcript_11952/m.26470 type:complete len:232 (-) Transcript_11952:169-864(-)
MTFPETWEEGMDSWPMPVKKQRMNPDSHRNNHLTIKRLLLFRLPRQQCRCNRPTLLWKATLIMPRDEKTGPVCRAGLSLTQVIIVKSHHCNKKSSLGSTALEAVSTPCRPWKAPIAFMRAGTEMRRVNFRYPKTLEGICPANSAQTIFLLPPLHGIHPWTQWTPLELLTRTTSTMKWARTMRGEEPAYRAKEITHLNTARQRRPAMNPSLLWEKFLQASACRDGRISPTKI